MGRYYYVFNYNYGKKEDFFNRRERIESEGNLEVLQKGVLEKSGRFWKMFEKAIREGVEKLSDYEVIALREWIYAKI